MIGIISPSSLVPKIELKLGVEKLRTQGFRVKVHPRVLGKHLYFAGSDEDRAKQIFEFARDPECEVLWCARGGYGAARLLPILDSLTRAHGAPRPGKLLVGYSDATALFEYVRREWGWFALHGPMPALRSFPNLKPEEWAALISWLDHRVPSKPWGRTKLRYAGGVTAREVEAELIGGNLEVWASLAGTSYFPETTGKILFFEEIGEYPYRIDRVVTHLDQARSFDDVRAVVLGDFLDCADDPSTGWADLKLKKLKPLRKKLDEKKLIPAVFAEVGARRGFPVFTGLPVGHGPGHFSLPMGARYHLSASGRLELVKWDWVGRVFDEIARKEIKS